MFMFPVPGPVTSPYGPRGAGFHHGVDFGWLIADPVKSRNIYAPASGTVTVGWNALVGNFVEIPTDLGLLRLAHFDSVAVKSGDQVVQGQTFLGVMGRTGQQSNGVHLHVDLFMKDGRVDPLPHFTIPFGAVSKPTPKKGNTPLMSAAYIFAPAEGKLPARYALIGLDVAGGSFVTTNVSEAQAIGFVYGVRPDLDGVGAKNGGPVKQITQAQLDAAVKLYATERGRKVAEEKSGGASFDPTALVAAINAVPAKTRAEIIRD